MKKPSAILLAVLTATLALADSADLLTPVRPGGVNGQPFWNANALWFMYPPAFDFREVKGASSYRFSVRDNFQREWTMTAAKPTAALVDVWTNLPPGLTVATCYGVNGADEVVGLAGSRSFWKQAPYKPGSYPKAKYSYREAARRLLKFLVDDWKPAQVLGKTGKPDFAYQYNGYPAKIGSSLINVMLMAAKELPEKKAKALDLARKEADYLLSVTPTEGPLAYFTPTYEYHPEAVGPNRHAPNACKRYLGQCMIRYSAEVGIAMLRLAQATGERKYADFAVKCGETFIRLQRPDGTWPCMMRYSDGAATRRDNIILIERVNFFTMLKDWTGDARYAKLEKDVFSQLERTQMTTWDWQGQFEDTPIDAAPYKDLTGTDALPAACYILKTFPGDAKRLAQAIELVRYGEDQFTCWEKPYRADGGSPSMGQTVEGKWYDSTYDSWFCPGVSEQYACMVPIDASACRMIWGYLALYKATREKLYLQKAETLGDSLVNRQQPNGGIDTYWYDTGMRFGDGCDEIDWLDCMMDDVEALLDLAALHHAPGQIEILLSPKAPNPTLFAAGELQKFLTRRFAGVEVPIVRQPTAGRFSIVLGTNDWSVAEGLRPEKLPRDSFILKSVPNRLYICGCDDPKANLSAEVKGGFVSNHERATLFGVYDFLEKHADCRFYFPGELGEIVPQAANLHLPAIDETVSPDFTVRRIYDGPNCAYFDQTGAKEGPVLNRLRTRMETELIPCCHGLNAFKYLDRFGKTHPEYFALSQGQRQVDPNYRHAGQLCWSSGVLEEIYRDARSYLKGEGPEVRGIPPMRGTGFSWNYNCVGGKYVDVMPQDAKMPCDCPDCVKACAGRGLVGSSVKVPNETDLVWSKVAAWGRRLKEEGIKGNLTMMSYQPYEDVPDFDLPDNIQVMLAVTGPFGKNDAKSTAKNDRRIADWVKKLGHKVWLWTYPNKYGNLEIRNVPQFSMHAWGAFYPSRRDKIFGAFAESETERWFYNHLNYYVFGRVMWDNAADVDAILNEYNERMFGPTAAAAIMGRVISTLEKKWMDEICGNVVSTSLGPQIIPPSDEKIWTCVYSPAFLSALEADFLAAESAAKKGPNADLVCRRLALYRREICDPLKAASEAYLVHYRKVRSQPTFAAREEIRLVPFRKDAAPDDPVTTASVWTEGDLFKARYVCGEPKMADILAVKRTRDEHFIWQDNNVEFFFCPTGDRSLVYQIIVNSEGSVTDMRRKVLGKGCDSDRAWSPDLKLDIRKEADRWICEIGVPLASIEPLAQEVPLCFGRSRTLKSGQVRAPYFTSSPLSPTWSDSACYPVWKR